MTPRLNPRAVGAVAVLGLIALANCAGLIGRAGAHVASSGWEYPPICCSDRDCASVPAASVGVSPQGWVFTIAPGTHPGAPAGGVFTVPQSDLQTSPDGLWHICILPQTGRVMCAFGPGMGS